MKPNRFCFTWNNYTDANIALLKSLSSRFLLFGFEVAPTTGTPHLQGYVEFSHSLTPGIRAIRKTLKGASVIPADGSAADSIQYICFNPDKPNPRFYEQGKPGNDQAANGRQGREAEKARWDAIRASAVSGDFESIESKVFVCQYNQIMAINRNSQPKLDSLSELCNGWFQGIPGSGKSFRARNMGMAFYNKDISKWWDGYQGEPLVIVDDVDPSHAGFLTRFLKIWADHYPFVAEAKGSSRHIRPISIVVTSQYCINEVFTDKETRAALHRRFETILFPNNGDF